MEDEIKVENIKYVSLDEEDFRCLVRGGILKVDKGKYSIHIILKDIGFGRMDKAIHDADMGIDIRKNHEKVDFDLSGILKTGNVEDIDKWISKLS